EALTHRYYECFIFEHLGLLRSVNLFSNADYDGLQGFLTEIDLVAAGLTLLLILSGLILWNRRNEISLETSQRRLPGAVWVLVAASLLMATRASYPLWKYVPQLEYMQTPDRWLVITVTGTCLLVAA